MMKALFEYLRAKPTSPTPKQPDFSSTYSSQEEMFSALNRRFEQGLCSPLTNLFAKSQIKDTPDILSKSNKDVYIDAVLHEDHQMRLRQEGKDGKHSAFIDTKIDYAVKTISVDDQLDLDMNQILPEPGHTMITYPVDDTNGKDSYHQVYMRKFINNQCLSFDASRSGGIKRGDCQELLTEFIEHMSTMKDGNRPPKRVIVATSSFSFFSGQQTSELKNEVNPSSSVFSH